MPALFRALWIAGLITAGIFAVTLLIIPLIIFGIIALITYAVIKEKEIPRQSRDVTIIRPPD